MSFGRVAGLTQAAVADMTFQVTAGLGNGGKGCLPLHFHHWSHCSRRAASERGTYSQPQMMFGWRRRRGELLQRPSEEPDYILNSARTRLSVKARDEFIEFRSLPAALLAQQGAVGPMRPAGPQTKLITNGRAGPSQNQAALDSLALVPKEVQSTFSSRSTLSSALSLHKQTRTVKPQFHPQWKLVRVISGHLGWVRSLAVEPGNKWFVSGAGDRVVKVWDLASGELRLSLTGHISTVRGLAVSSRHPYLFSCSEDKVIPVYFLPYPTLTLFVSRWSNAGIWK
jgi:WD40 repeat protein